jgi:hypothetical protein
MKRLAVAGFFAVTGLALLMAAIVHRPNGPLPQVNRVDVRAELGGGDHRFGDLVPGRLDVLVPVDRVDPASVTVATSFAPYRLVAPMHLERWRSGRTEARIYRFELECLDVGCAQASDRAGVLLTPAQVTYRSVDGTLGSTEAGWPTIVIVPRPKPALFSPWETGLRPLPATTYRLEPRTAAVLAVALALVALIGAALLLRPLLRRARRDASRRQPLLERALFAVRRAALLDDVDERRRALDLLGLALGRRRRERAEARTLAWSRGVPGGAAMRELADRAETPE